MKAMVKLVLVSLAAAAAGSIAYGTLRRQAQPARVSRLGEYRGYSEAVYDGYQISSDYLSLENGTKLAYDLILPTLDDVPPDGPLPTLFTYTPYLRTMTLYDEESNLLLDALFDLKWYERAMLRIRYWLYREGGHLMDPVFRTPWLENMLEHGYAVIIVERTGTGASFGVIDPSFQAAAAEVDRILDWIAAQPWSDGNIGMFGDSWQAMIQFAAASTGNPHLKAIFPSSASIDAYDAVNYPGGIYNTAFNTLFSASTSALETMVTPVDTDPGGEMLASALEERNSTVGEGSAMLLARHSFRDSADESGSRIWEDEMSLYPFVERINQANVPVYVSSGWYDLFPRDGFLWYANLTTPFKLNVRPLDHSEMEEEMPDLDQGVEAHRWFDYWLKGIDNGIMDEPPINYYVMGVHEENAWQSTDRWPLAEEQRSRFYLSSGRSGSVESINDGLLIAEPAVDPDGSDTYTLDYSTSSGVVSRWAAVLEPRDYPDMRTNDEKGLTYTTLPFEADLRITGHPIAHLWITTSATDLDLFVYLEEVDRSGRSSYITEGMLRASHRAQAEPPFDNLGLPFQRSYESDLAPIPADEPVELVFDLLPTAYAFEAGNRIRITVTCADAGNFDTPVLDPAPEMSLLRGGAYASYIELPLIAGQ
jgi:putative CocE/NonD family hydrolase